MMERPLVGQIVSPAETTRKRALAATANFLAIDRGDIVFCAKELTRDMATPTTADWEKVVRWRRYLKIRPDLWYKFQETPCQLGTFSETDWAGCKITRRSTTGEYTVDRISSHQIVVQNTSFVRASAETMGLITMYKDLGTHMNGLVLERCERSFRHCGPRRVGKLRHLDTNYLWIQEKAAKGDLDFKRVAGVDNGADLFTKTLSWNEIQSHIHKLSSQFVQNEISVNFVGARPNGVNLPQVLQEMGIAGGKNLAAWTRTVMGPRTRRTTVKGGHSWEDVVARVTADAVIGEILDSELSRDIARSLEHTPLKGEPRDFQTILVFEASKVISSSPILQDWNSQGMMLNFAESADILYFVPAAHKK